MSKYARSALFFIVGLLAGAWFYSWFQSPQNSFAQNEKPTPINFFQQIKAHLRGAADFKPQSTTAFKVPLESDLAILKNETGHKLFDFLTTPRNYPLLLTKKGYQVISKRLISSYPQNTGRYETTGLYSDTHQEYRSRIAILRALTRAFSAHSPQAQLADYREFLKSYFIQGSTPKLMQREALRAYLRLPLNETERWELRRFADAKLLSLAQADDSSLIGSGE